MKKIFILLLLLIIPSLTLNLSCYREAKNLHYNLPSKRLDAPANFFNKIEEYLNWQSENLLETVEEALDRFPPQVSEPIVRHMAMLMLDAVFHDVEAPNRPAVQKFHHARILKALKEIENTRVNTGAMIWKLYDMGFIVRTKTVTLGFDLIRGYSARAEGFAVTDSIYNAIVRQCDILFISHRHGDHADEWVAQTFLDQGKPVIAPIQIWPDKPIFDKITHLAREAHKQQAVRIQSGIRELQVIIYPGHQGASTLNNVTLVFTPEGVSLCHTGDQSLQDDFDWIDKVGEQFKIDVLMPNCWTTDPLRTSKGYNPKLIIPAHENELGHTIDHREAYALDYSRWNVPYPKLIMTWGESFHYTTDNR